MIGWDRVRRYISDNKWIVFAVTFFVLWKFFLIHTLWQDRLIPPGPDDSYIYILHIDSSLRCDNLISCSERAFSFDTYAGIDHLAYRVFLGFIGKLLSLDATAAYHLGFYVGTAVLALVLIFFLKNLDDRGKSAIAFSIFILALYNGSGSYHGFFWVVPSFFSLMLFLCILAVLLNDENKHWKSLLTIFTPLAVYTHILGLYLLAILPLFLAFYSFFTKKFHNLVLKKILFVIFVALLAYGLPATYFSRVSYGNPYGPENIAHGIFQQESSVSTTSKSEEVIVNLFIGKEPITIDFPGFIKIYSDYFRWIFPNLLAYAVFIVCIGTLFHYRYYKLLSLYFSGLAFVLLSSLNPHGERSLIFIWPMTFLLYGQAGWLLIRFSSEKITRTSYRILLKGFLLIVLMLSATLASSYSYLWNTYLNHARNIAYSEDAASYLIEHVSHNKTVAYSNDMNFLDAFMLLEYGPRKPVKTTELPTADYYVTLENRKGVADADFYESVFDSFFMVVSDVLLFHKESTSLTLRFPEESKNFTKERQFGVIDIYRINRSIR